MSEDLAGDDGSGVDTGGGHRLLADATRYGLTGGIGLVVNLTVLTALVESGTLSREVAPLVSLALALAVTFTLTDRWVFHRYRAPDAGVVARRVPAYSLLMLGGKGLNYAIYLALVGVGVPYPIAWVVGAGVVFCLTFTGNRLVWAVTHGRTGWPALRRLGARAWGAVGRDRVDRLLLVTILVAWAVAYLPRIGVFPLFPWDEASYANAARNLARGGDWIVPEVRVNFFYNDLSPSPRLGKPPLTYWLSTTAMLALGQTLFAARLPAALATLATAVVVYRTGSDLVDRWTGVAAGLAYPLLHPVFMRNHGGWAATPDPLMVLFGSLFVRWTLLGRDSPRHLWLAAVAAGLAVLSKGVAAGVFVVVLLPVLLIDWRSYLDRHAVAAVGITTAVALPWHLLAWRRAGDLFVQEYVFRSVLRRVEGQYATQQGLFEFMNYPYVTGLPEYLYPAWFVPFVLGAVLLAGHAGLGWRVGVQTLRRSGTGPDGDDGSEPVSPAPDRPADRRGSPWVLLWWVAAVPATFAITGGNHPWYLMPMLVPGAVLIGLVPATLVGRGLSTLGRDLDPSSLRAVAGYAALGLCAVGLVIAGTAAFGTVVSDKGHHQRDIGRAVDATVPPGETVHLWPWPGGFGRDDALAFSYYADRPLASPDGRRLATDPAVRYAVVPVDRLADLRRPHTVVERGGPEGVAFVALGPPVGDAGGGDGGG